MFSKLHHPLSPSLHHSPDSSAVSAHRSGEIFRKDTAVATSCDGASIEVVHRPRGRPRGSKNKPKPPVFLTRQPYLPQMSPYILEVSSGNDVVGAIDSYCRRKGLGVCILNGSGAVIDVTFRQPAPAASGSTVTFHGEFDILSISATLLPPPRSAGSSEPSVSNDFAVSLAGPQGQIVGGFVTGPLIAAGNVYVVAAGFNNPTFHRLPIEDETRTSGGSTGTGDDEDGKSPPTSAGGDSNVGHVTGGGGESMYGFAVGWS